MYRDEGRNTLNTVLALVIAGISLVIGVYVFGEVDDSMGDTADYYNFSLKESNFSENVLTSSEWMTDTTNIATIEWDGDNEWVDIGASGSGTGVATVSQNVTIDPTDTVEHATASFDWRIENADNLTEVVVSGIVIDPDGNTHTVSSHTESTTVAWSSESDSIADYIDEAGTYEIVWEADEDVAGDGFELDLDNADIDVQTSENPVGGITDDLWGAFGMAPILLIVLVAAAIIAVLTKFR